VLLKTGSGRVSGTVHDGVGGIIVLVPKDERLLPEFMAVPLFSSGRFQVENVHPGDYYACFVMGRNHAGWGTGVHSGCSPLHRAIGYDPSRLRARLRCD
jgi:hypothetical protein